MVKSFVLILLLFSLRVSGAENEFQKQVSPDGNLSVLFYCKSDGIFWSVESKAGVEILAPSGLGLSFLNAPTLGKNLMISKVIRREINEPWQDSFGKCRQVANEANEMYVELEESVFPGRKLGICFRAYNEGVAFRYYLPEHTALLGRTIIEENTEFVFGNNRKVWCPVYPSYTTGQEMEYLPTSLSDLKPASIVGLPLLAEISKECYVVISEANIRNWCGMYLGRKETDENVLQVKLPPLVRKNGVNEVGESPRGHKVKLEGEVYSPWRFLMVADNPGKLLESCLVKNLSEPCKIEDTSWIEPGICVWDNWWSNNTKMNTETVKTFIDFASENGFPYQLIDWRWYGTYNNPKADITRPVSEIDMVHLLEYAGRKNVRLWLWVHYNDFVRQPEALAVYEKWGVAGIKIDFMNRDDQTMVDWYEATLKAAAKHHLMINFHGAYKPDGLSRTYPNLVTREGVLGNEYNKNSSRVTPDHNVMLAYTRALLGEMDYTPGGFLNKGKGEFCITSPTQVQGTRCHQLALFVVYESPLTTLCDAPAHYRNQPGFNFVKEVPCVWMQTRFLAGELGEYICLARQDAVGRWFVSALNNSRERNISICLDFLPDGEHTACEYRDDLQVPASVNVVPRKKVSKNDVVNVSMAAGGGFNMIIDLNKEMR